MTYMLSLEYITTNYIIVILITIAAFFKKNTKKKEKISLDSLLYIGFIIICALGFLFNNNSSDMTFVKHTLSYSFILICYGIFLPMYLEKNDIKIEMLLKWISIMVLITCAFALLEFFARNFIPSLLNIFQMLKLDSIAKYDALYFEKYQRSRAFMSESGHFAMFVNAFLPVSLYYLNKYKRKSIFIIYSIICISGYVVSFSAGSFVSIAVSFFIIYPMYAIEVRSKKKILFFIMFLFISLITLYFVKDIPFFQGIKDKLFLVNDSGRFWRWQFSYESFRSGSLMQILMGRGLGYLSYNFDTGSTNWFIETVVETGIMGFLTITSILALSIKRIISLKSEFKYFILIGLISMIIQYNIISDYWYPWIWTTMALTRYFKYVEYLEEGDGDN